MNADQILDAEMQSHAEHEQGNPDPRQLLSLVGVCDQPGRERAHGDTREQVSDDGGQSHHPGEIARDERRTQRDGDGGDEVSAVDLDRILQTVREGGLPSQKAAGDRVIHATWDVMTTTPRPLLLIEDERVFVTANVVILAGSVDVDRPLNVLPPVDYLSWLTSVGHGKVAALAYLYSRRLNSNIT